MKKNRFLNIFLIAALTLMVALTIQGAVATAQVALAAGNVDQGNAPAAAPLCDFPAVERQTIHRVYVEQMDTWITYTDRGPTGVDGGLIELLSGSRDCSQ